MSKHEEVLGIARAELGVKEPSPRIQEYHAAAGYPEWGYAVPWCASFMSWVFKHAGFSFKTPDAGKWLEFGTATKKPVAGDICVFSRKGGHHVALYIKSNLVAVYILGGNQGDKVCYEWKLKTGLLGYRTY